MKVRVAFVALSLISASASAVAQTAPRPNPFDGYYIAGGGGYGVGSGRTADKIYGPLTGVDSISVTATSGVSGSVAAGRNIIFGWGLVGLEVDGRWSDEKSSGSLPSFALDFASGTSESLFSYKNDAGVHAAIRIGATFDELLVFAKAGVGATRITETFTADERGRSLSVLSSGTFNSATSSTWLPSVLLGVGIEKNWGPLFGRLGADFEAFNHSTTTVNGPAITASSSSSQIMWNTRGTAMIGFRF